MWIPFLLTILAFIGGGLCVFFAVETRRRRTLEIQAELDSRKEELRAREESLSAAARKFHADRDRHAAEYTAHLAARKEFDSRIISYDELVVENGILKTDLRNLAMNVARREFEQEDVRRNQREIDEKANTLGRAYLKDTQKWILNGLTQNNYATSKDRLTSAIERIRDAGVPISAAEEKDLLGGLQAEYERVVRAALEREEQARIRALIREEQQQEREAQEKIEQTERERMAVESALNKALAEAKGHHNAEVQRLQQELADAIPKSQRAKSMAQLTKAGNVYVISNLGSFGADVFKIGMTRRLDPLDRVLELGDASVPFPFDVHMMISTPDAPALENAMHKAFHRNRLNKTNPRKEFFRTTITDILEVVKKNHGEVEYIADMAALQYHQSLTMSVADQEFIEHVFEEVEEEKPALAEDE